MPDRNICILSATAAIVSGRGVRSRKDGSVFGEYGWTYTLVKTGDGWRICAKRAKQQKTGCAGGKHPSSSVGGQYSIVSPGSGGASGDGRRSIVACS